VKRQPLCHGRLPQLFPASSCFALPIPVSQFNPPENPEHCANFYCINFRHFRLDSAYQSEILGIL
jgi:hypothetical protein